MFGASSELASVTEFGLYQTGGGGGSTLHGRTMHSRRCCSGWQSSSPVIRIDTPVPDVSTLPCRTTPNSCSSASSRSCTPSRRRSPATRYLLSQTRPRFTRHCSGPLKERKGRVPGYLYSAFLHQGTHKAGGAVVQRVRHLGLRSVGRGFKSCSRQRCITTLGKLFTPMRLCHQAV